MKRVLQMQCGCTFVVSSSSADSIRRIERRWSCGVELLAHPPFIRVGQVQRVAFTVSVA